MQSEARGATADTSALDAERRWYRDHHLFADLLRAHVHAGGSRAQTSEIYAVLPITITMWP